jgi:hypothetical protein
MNKQVYRCNTRVCSNETHRTLPSVKWLQIEIAKCEKCGRLIIFSTLFQPTLVKDVKRASDLP